jgi:NitT/TauT family transport system ATP-binding protein
MIPGSSTGEVVLSVRRVISIREGERVLDGVSFDILDRLREGATTGQVVSLLGRSGAGKTTLLRIMAGIDRPTSGVVRGVKDAKLGDHEVGIVFQDYPLIAHRTVLDNLVVAGRMGGMSRERAHNRAMELLERVGLEDLAERWPAQLSGGQRQRVAIAQCLVLPRRVLLLDEPFSGLDPVAIAEVSQLITEVANDHDLNTIVIVTHDIHAAVGVSDTILLLGKSKIAKRFDLVDLGVAWHQGTKADRAALEGEIEQAFREL